ncbi:MAG TPA: YihY/virulence factor BrkB family protein [Chloroflexi bacterium]|nr:YihY/virulence factor BrkB family protein [Chloroflexota bacterium]
MKPVVDHLHDVCRRIEQYSVVSILQDAMRHFGEVRAAEAAAGLAYYALFSLFPLMIALVSVGGVVLEREQAYQQTVDFFIEAFPASQQLIERNVERVFELRSGGGMIALLGLLWSASGAFSILVRNVNRAWEETDARDLIKSRLLALGMIGVLLVILLLLSLASNTMVELLPRLEASLWGEALIYDTFLWSIVATLLPWFFSCLMFLGLYRWTPSAKVDWRAAIIGSLTASLFWEGLSEGFAWYLGSGFVQYELVYGSLGAVVALLFWIYLSSYVTLFGAHLSAAVGRYLERA